MSRPLRILAVDQGSKACGFAYLEGTAVTTDVMTPREAWPWAERMDFIAEQLIHATHARKWEPEVVAIEDVVLHVHKVDGLGVTANVKTVLTMGETRGYLKRLVRELWPNARIIDISPSSTKAATGAPRARDEAKAHTKRVVGAALHRRDITEDEADAVAIGWAAQARLESERLDRLAGEQMTSSRSP